jgi:hypothetical protein
VPGQRRPGGRATKPFDATALTGALRDRQPDGNISLEFRYQTVRVWRQPLEAVLAGHLATLHLAPLAAGAEAIFT